ncbi:serine/threonine phosphatase [Gloeothece verrucosa]|uniref:Protein serine/threonine phosphatase n=1 Tax=Gloeothece verrucosa (strain PCC 7822) TaxID=497965 RepID=E0UDE8_GLOV7|nr:serine/threonine phosphatase [Gloeothece verrucosa]ADN14139.1 protein serine/threonine phosphatase [Gloeothece verrucosa PCC 7822]
MLVCPQCQYDNPNSSQSCTRCGTSLSYKDCGECGTMISFEAEKCPHCGAFTATVWWAVIALEGEAATKPVFVDGSLAGHQPLKESPTPEPLFDSSQQSATAILEQPYLDPGQRYRLMADVQTRVCPQKIPKPLCLEGLVVDCQPLQKSVLKALLEEQGEWLNQDDHAANATLAMKNLLWHQLGISQLALPYLSLGKFYPLIPEIHEVWSDESQDIILLENRSNWQPLSLFLSTEELPSLQILYWFNEMASLWTPLSEVHCCQSLLMKNNLRVDEDQTLGLMQLYDDPADVQPTLEDLGRMWQELLQESQQQNLEPLLELVKQVIAGEIDSISQLCLELQNLGNQQQVKDLNLSEESLNGYDVDEQKVEAMSLPFEFYQNDESLDTEEEDETIIEGNMSEDLSTADLPMQLLSLSDAGATDIGRQRRHNEDHFGIETEITKQHSNRGQKVRAKGLYIVCDGMGGHASGEVASALAVDTLQRYFATHWTQELPDAETIEQGILLANETIYQVNQDQDSYGSGRMGTTLVMVLLEGTRVVIAHVGDSRIYQINRKWGLEQLTVDHEVGQRAITEGIAPEIAYSRPDAYQLTQALGPHENQYVKPDIKYLDLHEDTLLLLCSDGLSDNQFLETNYETCLTPLISSSANLDEGLRKMMALANQKNGHDNITAIIVRIKLQPYFDQPL